MSIAKGIVMGFGWCILLASYITYAITFATAYTRQDKAILIEINSFREANMELGLIILTFGFVIISLPTIAKSIVTEMKEYYVRKNE